MSTLAELKTSLEYMIGSAVDPLTWTAAMKEEALRSALLTYTERGPISEIDFTVITAGKTHILSTITNIYSISDLAYPWSADLEFENCPRRWRTIDQLTVYLLGDAYPSVGEEIRVRYRKLYTISSLDGAADTTIPLAHERAVLLLAAIGILDIRLRQISENPAIPPEAVAAMTALHERWTAEVDRRLDKTSGLLSNPSWAGVGL